MLRIKAALSAFFVAVILLLCICIEYGKGDTRQTTEATTQPRAFPPTLTSNLPFDVNVSRVRDLVEVNNVPAAHAEFDILAWQAFIALNWPANPDGSPSTTLDIANVDAPRVWEFWRPAQSIFLANGATPDPWNDKPWNSAPLVMSKAAWRQHTTAASNLEAFSGPLVDQNGNWVRYQIRVNREEFDYIVQNTLYNQDGQIDFSKSNRVELPLNSGQKRHGAIELKFAWKELGANDDRRRFLIRKIDAELSEPVGADGKPQHRLIEAGLN